MSVCKVPFCGKRVHAFDLCKMHYRRIREGGGLATAKILPSGVGEAFVRAAVHAYTDECLPWPFRLNDSGYGVVRIDGERYRAHRAVLMMYTGDTGEGLHALHLPKVCHNRACVNPKHLRWGTDRDNQDDMYLDGTVAVGEDNPYSRLTEADVINIRNSSETLAVLAKRYDVNKATVWHAKTGSTWTHLPMP